MPLTATYTGDLIGYSTALLITILLLVLTLRAAKLPGTSRANVLFAMCAFFWSAGGLLQAAILASQSPGSHPWIPRAQAIQFTGLCSLPIPILAAWRNLAVRPWQRTAMAILHAVALASAAIFTILLWTVPTGRGIEHASGTSAALLLLLGAAFALRRANAPRAVFGLSLGIVIAACGAVAAISIAVHHHHQHLGLAMALAGIGTHLALLMFLCTYLLFARFRYADVFIRYGVRILLCGFWVSILTFLAQSWVLLNLAHRSASPGSIHVFLVLVLANIMLISMTFVDERLANTLNRWLFHAPDYREATRHLTNQLRNLALDSEILSAVEDAARLSLELSGAQVVSAAHLAPTDWPTGLLDGETVEIAHSNPLRARLPLAGVEVLVPISVAGRAAHILLIAPGLSRPGLLTRDLQFLSAIASQSGARLDALRREREAVERQSRESLLRQQLSEAELAALRAQINPHFLFNSLNTIADLIVRDPARAETMTLRLAGVFRHVLAHTSRPFSTVGEEVEFLRTYLSIEEARFGDRLTVEIDMPAPVTADQIPSLILQPLVENALKHGLAPKPGPVRLRISARHEAGRLHLLVEDDGMGPSRTGEPGVGLANVAARLETLYHDRAGFTLEPRLGGGSLATIVIPLNL